MSPVLIDTSLWILVFKEGAPEAPKKEVGRIISEGSAATCGMILVELLGGTRTPKEYVELLEELQALHYLPVTDRVWLSASRLSFELRRKGLTIPSTDVLIASVALNSKCLLLHSDHHFELISEHTNLKSHIVE
ncbi:MAG: PIN domain nuclease [Gemmatimonadota bacterium]|nr:MAG: PIN domain nuclease [Gemmatimonadota bacterium]